MTILTQIITKNDFLSLVRKWLNSGTICNAHQAHLLCKIIPAQCPFERNIVIFNYKLFRIPPMCKLNPLYEEVVSLRFKALCYLAEECGENITESC
ncbi:MAG: Mo-dependent nitrogenase C-terminal domain-containing protein [Fischerella sp. CENA71]|nr:Mo-dependent nitrogenase C-terminal domain-containing protein [Fischerella sp. CENA71]